MRRAIFGGSFDPIHLGHLLLAETAREVCALDQVIFMPAGIPPHKKTQKRASGKDRHEMIRRAIDGSPNFIVSSFEIDSSEISYTIETLYHFKRLYPEDELFLIVGSEMFSDLPRWVRPQEICQTASLITAHRAGFPEPDFSLYQDLVSEQKLADWKKQVIPMPPVGFSSTQIRNRIKSGKSVRFMIPDSVIEYIQVHRLYLD